ncbi:PREDICTED: type I inositol polyphosphate 5-phosphatase 8-like [Lupinus angustifolius]|uniref:type I inositol polyphosphate 5-phosphatase 8-like n=1 Tax=Lupinus angustifolius TaxID=3871 RepID=UPI00092F203C|nr:PREDICTED: type I inositol polyphosphate 5-phosphatase 8-like [Lupinus angustifolius]
MRSESKKVPKLKSWWLKLAVRKWLNRKSSANKLVREGLLMDSSHGMRGSELRNEETHVPVTDALDLRMFVGTWNVGGKSPNDSLNLRDWLKSPSQPHIYVIGLQEIVPLNTGNVIGPEDIGPISKWVGLISEALNNNHNKRATHNERDYWVVVERKQMVGIFLCVWIHIDLYTYVSNINVSCVGRGIMGYLGNKGSISISMRLSHTTFCFVCTHLASGEKNGDEIRRNLDVSKILKKTKFPHPFKSHYHPQTILEHDNVIWLGDLNYRLVPGYKDTHELLKMNNWQALLEMDQLRIEQRAGRVFKGWNEGRIYFAPTYKYLANSDNYVAQTSKSKEKKRTPAWCDRILWKGEGLKQMWYVRGESKFSDHRPVYSLFSLQLDLRSKYLTPTPFSSTFASKVQVEEQILVLEGYKVS